MAPFQDPIGQMIEALLVFAFLAIAFVAWRNSRVIRTASGESQAMSDPTSDVDEAACWHCGAPADPHCARSVQFGAFSASHKDAQGYPVVRFLLVDRVRVHVPRCEGCRNRHWLAVFLFPTCIIVGMVFGGVVSSWGWIVGGFIVFVTFPRGFVLYERFSGRRTDVSTYPPIQRLRQAGWGVMD